MQTKIEKTKNKYRNIDKNDYVKMGSEGLMYESKKKKWEAVD